MKRFLFLFWILFFASPGYSIEEYPTPVATDYHLNIRIDYDAEKLFADCTIDLFNKSDQPVITVPLLLYRLLDINSVLDARNDSLEYDQRIVSISGWEKIQVNFIRVTLPEALPPGGTTSIRLNYAGYLLGYAEANWRYVKDHIARDFTIIRRDGYGYPVIGYPDVKRMWPNLGDIFDYEIRVTVPPDIRTATGGKLVEKIPNENVVTWVWRSVKPSWRMDIALGDYRVLQHGQDRVRYFNGDSLGAFKIMNAMIQSLDLYTEWFGPLEDYPGYTVIEVPEGYGSQADVAAILVTADVFHKPDNMRVIYHEISHLWNVPALERQPCRLESEGLAQFLQFRLLELLDGKPDETIKAADWFIQRTRNAFGGHPEYIKVPIKDYGVKDMTEHTYIIGMVVISLLHDLMGDEAFNQAIGSFYAKYHDQGASLDDFVNHCKACTTKDLSVFFRDWVYTPAAIEQVMAGKNYQDFDYNETK